MLVGHSTASEVGGRDNGLRMFRLIVVKAAFFDLLMGGGVQR
jgi:hypothetical protein